MFKKVKNGIGNLWPALRSRNYRLYFVGQGVSLVGTLMASTAQQWLVYPILTRNQSMLGVMSAINSIPTIILLLFAGVIADRTNRRLGMLVQQVFYAVIAFALFALVATGTIQLWHVIIATFLSGAIFAFDMTTRQAFMIELVNKDAIASAISLNTGIFSLGRVIGPVVAGVFITSMGIASAFFLNGISFIAVIGGILLISLPPSYAMVKPKSLRKDLISGVEYVRKKHDIGVSLLLLFVLSVCTAPVFTLLPVFAHDVFRVGGLGFGVLSGAIGLGAVVGSFGFSPIYARLKEYRASTIVLLLLLTISLAGFAVLPWYPTALLLLFIGGFGSASLMSLVRTVIHEQVPSLLRGRLVSFYSLALIGGTPLGALAASVGVAAVGARFTVFISAILFGLTSFGLIAASKGKFQEKLARMV